VAYAKHLGQGQYFVELSAGFPCRVSCAGKGKSI
jgi:hypothetical protein